MPVRLTHWARQGCLGSDLNIWQFKNVVLAAQAAAAKDITVIGMTGNKQGALHDSCDLVISAPSDITMHIQECHIALGHAITAAVEILVSETQE